MCEGLFKHSIAMCEGIHIVSDNWNKHDIATGDGINKVYSNGYNYKDGIAISDGINKV